MISFITLVCNRTTYLFDAMESLRNQATSVPVEVVVYDTSKESQREIVESCAKNLKLVYQYAPREEAWPPYIGRLWNAAIALSSGEYIAFLDDDDMKAPLFAEKMTAPMRADPDLDVTLCNGRLIVDGAITLSPLFGTPVLGKDPHDHLTTGKGFITTGQLCVRRRVFDKVQFDPELPVSEDYDFVTRLCGFKSLVDQGDALTFYRVHSDSLSDHSRSGHITQVSLRRMLLKHSIISDQCTQCGGPVVDQFHIYHNSNHFVVICGNCRPV